MQWSMAGVEVDILMGTAAVSIYALPDVGAALDVGVYAASSLIRE